jgi:dTDP-4-dehydrorhamnose reductase
VKILLLGRNGQLGRALAPALAPLGEIVALDRAALDLADLAAIPGTVARHKPDLVVNAAAYTAVDRAESEAELAMTVNGRAPGVLAEAARDAKAALIHFSTDYVFDGTLDRPYREDDAPAPLNAYGRSKLAGERAVMASGAVALVLRTSWLYGPGGANFLETMLKLGRERDALRVVNDQWGAPTSVQVVAGAAATILSRAKGDPVAYLGAEDGLCHLACAGQTTWHGFALAIFEEGRRRGMSFAVKTVQPIPASGYPTPARRPANSRLDLGRLKQRFGIVTPDWRAALGVAMDAVTARDGGRAAPTRAEAR